MVMCKGSDGFGFASEASEMLRAAGVNDFDGHIAKEMVVMCEIDFCHPTTSYKVFELMVSECTSFQSRHMQVYSLFLIYLIYLPLVYIIILKGSSGHSDL